MHPQILISLTLKVLYLFTDTVNYRILTSFSVDQFFLDLSVPVSLFSGTHDFLADPEDVELLENTIPSAVVVHKIIDGFNHVDFTWGVNAAREIYDVIIEQMKNNG